MSAKKWLLGLLYGGVLAVVGASAAFAAETTVAAATDGDDTMPAVYASRGVDTCLQCHDSGKDVEIMRTAHAVRGDDRTPMAQHACESCHGASPEHVASKPAKGEKRAAPTVLFKGDRVSSVEARNKQCVSCHENSARIYWQASQHSNGDVACTNCHTLHTVTDAVTTKEGQPKVCFSCHTDKRADSYKLSHHPVREGKVSCSDCHNPHGSVGQNSIKEVRVNDTCYNCHADKRGPFLWEHQPVKEDCTICHNPHGASQARLLIERPNFLCQECHLKNIGTSTGGHNGGTWFLQNPTTSNGFTGPALQSNYRGCLNCHSNIHGSNATDGAYFNR